MDELNSMGDVKHDLPNIVLNIEKGIIDEHLQVCVAQFHVLEIEDISAVDS